MVCTSGTFHRFHSLKDCTCLPLESFDSSVIYTDNGVNPLGKVRNMPSWSASDHLTDKPEHHWEHSTPALLEDLINDLTYFYNKLEMKVLRHCLVNRSREVESCS